MIAIINYRLPQGCTVSFDSIVLYTRKPLPVTELNAGNKAKIQIGYAFPKKNLLIEDTIISNNLQIKNCKLKASQVQKIRTKIRGSQKHHKFAYKIKGGILQAQT